MEMFNDRSTPQYTVKEFFAVVFKHYKKAILLFITIFLAVIATTFTAPEVYQTEAKLFIRIGNQTLNEESISGNRVQISQTMDNQLNSEIQILQSRELAESIYDALGKQAFQDYGNKYNPGSRPLIDTLRQNFNAILSFPKTAIGNLLSGPAPPDENLLERIEADAAIHKIQDQLSAELVMDSNIIILRYEDTSPERARDVLKQLIDIYMAKRIELNNSPGAFEFFRTQSDAFQQQLETTEAQYKEAKNEIGIGSLEEHRTLLSTQIGGLQQKMEEAESNIASSMARIVSLKARLANLPENTVVSETTDSAPEGEDQLYDLKMKEQELLSTFTKDSIPVIEIRRQIQEVETLMRQSKRGIEVTKGVNPMHQQLKISLMLEYGTLDALRAQQQALAQQRTAADAKLQKLNIAEVKLSKMNREKTILEENYRKYASNLEQVRIDKARETEKLSNISIAQAPVVPIEPIRPRKTLNLALGLFLALFGGLGLAFFMEYLDDKLRKPEDVENMLELPLLGSIMKLESGST